MNKKIDLSCGFEELRRNLEVSEDMEEWKAMGEIERRGKVENQLPTIQEENENELGIEFLETEENGWDQSHNRTQPETNGENLENVESGGGEITTVEELEGLVGDECMELREEKVQMIKK